MVGRGVGAGRRVLVVVLTSAAVTSYCIVMRMNCGLVQICSNMP